MNLTVKECVRTLHPRYGGLSDTEIIEKIRIGQNAGEALFYLLFGRYQEMLHAIFCQEATSAMDFSDFMFELNMRLFANDNSAINKFDADKASFKTYLSRIAHNLLFDLRKKEQPTIDYSEEFIEQSADDGHQMMLLIDAINSYADRDARYVLFKVIEGYKSKEIAIMLSSRRHEEGTLDESEELKPSYIDTIRSRALQNLHRQITENEQRRRNIQDGSARKISTSKRQHFFYDELQTCALADDECYSDEPIFAEIAIESDYSNLFIKNLHNLLYSIIH